MAFGVIRLEGGATAMYKLGCRMKCSLLDVCLHGETDGSTARRAGEHKWNDQIS